MYTRQEAAQRKQEFWTTFGQYMAPILSAEGEKVNWVNYKTGEKNIAFRMQADNMKASFSVELTHKDPDIQQLYFEQFMQLRRLFEEAAGADWQWQLHTADEHGRLVSKIEKTKEGVSIFRKEDWPQLITFFKKEIVTLDDFWGNVKYSFESLR